MELIDRTSFDRCWACTHHATGECDTWCDAGEAFEMREDVANAKVIDTEPTVHGKWVICPDGYYPYCSVCKSEPTRGVMKPYCADCGAKMDL